MTKDINNDIIYVDKWEDMLANEDIVFHYEKMMWHRRKLEQLIQSIQSEKGIDYDQT